MSIKGIVIEKFAKWYIGGVHFESIKRVVASLMDSSLSGQAKQAIAINEIQKFGYDLSAFLINLGIELAVGYLKAQANK